jgi:hypothetical protein
MSFLINPFLGGVATYPSFVNIGTAVTASGTTMTLNLPASRVVGNVMIALTSVASSRSPVWPAGWTGIGAGFAAYRVIDGTESTGPAPTWTGSSAQGGIIGQWTGTAGGVGATNDNQAQTGTTASVTAITTTANISLCVTGLYGTTTTPSLPSGFNNETTATIGGAQIRFAEVQVATSGGSSGAVSSTVTNGIWRAVLIELKS